MKVLAKIRLLPTSDGGRATGLKSFYRPNHNFGLANETEFFAGQIELPAGLEPGQTTEAEVHFLPAPALSDLLVVGRRWRLQEANKLVGEGEVLRVLNAP